MRWKADFSRGHMKTGFSGDLEAWSICQKTFLGEKEYEDFYSENISIWKRKKNSC